MMKNTFLIFLILVTLATTSCGDEDMVETNRSPQMSKAVSDYLALKFGGQNNSTGLESNIAGPANTSFSGMLGNFGFRGGRLDSADAADTVVYEDPWEWKTCAEVTISENADGSTKEVYDYGDGCFEGSEEYQYWMHGKYTSTFKNEYSQNGTAYFDEYTNQVLFENYGGKYYGDDLEGGESSWLSNGYSDYSGNSTYDEATGIFKGVYEYDSEMTHIWNEAEYFSKSLGSSRYDQDKFIIDGVNEYESINDPALDYDYYYKSNIIEPLVYDYSCYHNYYESFATNSYWFFAYVSGKESIEFRENGLIGSFVIDYGDGSCDNLVTIIENGFSYDIDIVELYQ